VKERLPGGLSVTPVDRVAIAVGRSGGAVRDEGANAPASFATCRRGSSHGPPLKRSGRALGAGRRVPRAVHGSGTRSRTAPAICSAERIGLRVNDGNMTRTATVAHLGIALLRTLIAMAEI
jgi:DNA-binding transcriptional LysR family regulator